MTKELFFEGLAGGATWSAGVAFKRSNPLPLDRYSVFDSKAAADEYLSNAVCYPGQVLAVVENITDSEGTVTGITTTVYVVEVDTTGAYSLKEVGTKPIGDDASIEIKEDGTVTLYGFDTATDGYIPQKNNGKVEWVPISSVVEGDTNTVTSGDGNTIQTSGDADALTAKLVGFDNATEGQVAYKTAEGKLGWKDEVTYDDSQVTADIEALESRVDVDSVSGAIATAKTEAINAAATDAADKYVAKEGYIEFTQDEKDKLAGLDNYDDSELAGKVQTLETGLSDANASITAVQGDVNTIKGDYLKAADKDEIVAGYQAADEAIDTRLQKVETFFETAEGETLDTALDTLKEIQNYITTDGAAADEMVQDIADNKAAIEAEKARAEGIEAGLRTDVDAKADATQVATDIATAKQEAIDAAAEAATIKDEQVLIDAKAYTDAEIDKVEELVAANTAAIATAKEEAATDAQTKADAAQAAAEKTAADALALAKTELQGNIDTVDSKLVDYAKTADVNSADEALDARIDEVEANYAKTTDVNSKIAEVNAEVANKAAQTDLDAIGEQVNALAGIKTVAEGELAIDGNGELSITAVEQGKVTGLANALASKVDKKSTIYNDVDTEWTLLSPENQAKLEALVIGDQGVEISGTVNAENVQGLDSYITGKRDSLGGLLSVTNEDKLNNIEDNAQVNKLEKISLAGTEVVISSKTATIPYATADLAGIVKSATANNTVAVGTDGVMTVNSITTDKLVQGTDTFIIDGGNASV